MGLSSSKSKTTSTQTTAPSALTSPYVQQGLQDSQAVLNANQGTLQGLSASALAGYNAIAPQSYSPSPYVTAAQQQAQSIGSGSKIGTNPGASTYTSLQNSTNPALAAYMQLVNGGAPGTDTLNSFASTGTNGMANSADAYDQAVLSGQYLNNNPYIDAITNQATAAATKAANQRFGAAGLGAGLSSAYDSALGSAVADANNTTRYTAYNAERQLQDAASGRVSANYNAGQDRSQAAAGTLGSNALAAASGLSSAYGTQAQTQLGAATAADSNYQSQLAQQLQALGMTSDLTNAQYAGIAPSLALLQAAATTPYTGVNAYAGLLGTLANPYTTTTGSGTSTQSSSLGSILGGVAGAGLSGWATGGFKLSDRRAKTDIEKVGEAPDGLGIYSYRYKAGGPVQIGVMADEVAILRPWALGPMVEDVRTINYDMLEAA